MDRLAPPRVPDRHRSPHGLHRRLGMDGFVRRRRRVRRRGADSGFRPCLFHFWPVGTRGPAPRVRPGSLDLATVDDPDPRRAVGERPAYGWGAPARDVPRLGLDGGRIRARRGLAPTTMALPPAPVHPDGAAGRALAREASLAVAYPGLRRPVARPRRGPGPPSG